jgi:hypothetical protein
VLCGVGYPVDICQFHLIYGVTQFWNFFVDFLLDDLSIVDKHVLKSSTTTMLGSICYFKVFSVCLI